MPEPHQLDAWKEEVNVLETSFEAFSDSAVQASLMLQTLEDVRLACHWDDNNETSSEITQVTTLIAHVRSDLQNLKHLHQCLDRTISRAQTIAVEKQVQRDWLKRLSEAKTKLATLSCEDDSIVVALQDLCSVRFQDQSVQNAVALQTALGNHLHSLAPRLILRKVAVDDVQALLKTPSPGLDMKIYQPTFSGVSKALEELIDLSTKGSEITETIQKWIVAESLRERERQARQLIADRKLIWTKSFTNLLEGLKEVSTNLDKSEMAFSDLQSKLYELSIDEDSQADPSNDWSSAFSHVSEKAQDLLRNTDELSQNLRILSPILSALQEEADELDITARNFDPEEITRLNTGIELLQDETGTLITDLGKIRDITQIPTESLVSSNVCHLVPILSLTDLCEEAGYTLPAQTLYKASVDNLLCNLEALDTAQIIDDRVAQPGLQDLPSREGTSQYARALASLQTRFDELILPPGMATETQHSVARILDLLSSKRRQITSNQKLAVFAEYADLCDASLSHLLDVIDAYAPDSPTIRKTLDQKVRDALQHSLSETSSSMASMNEAASHCHRDSRVVERRNNLERAWSELTALANDILTIAAVGAPRDVRSISRSSQHSMPRSFSEASITSANRQRASSVSSRIPLPSPRHRSTSFKTLPKPADFPRSSSRSSVHSGESLAKSSSLQAPAKNSLYSSWGNSRRVPGTSKQTTPRKSTLKHLQQPESRIVSKYRPNPHRKLDVQVAKVVNALPVSIFEQSDTY